MLVCLIDFLYTFSLTFVSCFNHVGREDHLAFDTTKGWKLHG